MQSNMAREKQPSFKNPRCPAARRVALIHRQKRELRELRLKFEKDMAELKRIHDAELEELEQDLIDEEEYEDDE